jgi:hypothetical protein
MVFLFGNSHPPRSKEDVSDPTRTLLILMRIEEQSRKLFNHEMLERNNSSFAICTGEL